MSSNGMARAFGKYTPHIYKGPVKACILDWSGTMVDKYVIAPAVTFVEIFARHKVPITMHEAREPMGLRKDLHIAAIAAQPAVAQRWREVYSRDVTTDDIDRMFADFVPHQLSVLRRYATLLPGAAESVEQLRQHHDIRIGVTTGFLRSMVDLLLEETAKHGFVPDVTVAGDDVINGARPRPFMVHRNLDLLDVYPIQAAVKVDDTASGVGEAVNAGCWGVGVARYSNYMDVDSEEHEATLSGADIEKRLAHTRDVLWSAGAHYVVNSMVDLPDVISDINQRLARGEKP